MHKLILAIYVSIKILCACRNTHTWAYTLKYITDLKAQTNVETFIYVTFISRFFAIKHSLIVFMPDLCTNFIQKVILLL